MAHPIQAIHQNELESRWPGQSGPEYSADRGSRPAETGEAELTKGLRRWSSLAAEQGPHHAADGTPYDYHHLCYKFSVRSGTKQQGIFNPPHRWEFEPAGSPLTAVAVR